MATIPSVTAEPPNLPNPPAKDWSPTRAPFRAREARRLRSHAWTFVIAAYGAAVAFLVPTCVWRITPALIVALEGQLGDPVDAYVNGSQTWLRDDGPGQEAIEWRLHPVAGYRKPDGVSHYEVFAAAALTAATGATGPDAVALWDGLEAFPAYGDELEPVPLAVALGDLIGIAPDAAGLVDHDRIADEWEQSGGRTSISTALFAQLDAAEPT